MSLRGEYCYPYVSAAVAGGIAGAVAGNVEPFPDAFIAGTMTLGVVVAGFTATQRNMLLNMEKSRIRQFLVKTGLYRHIISYLRQSVYAALLVVLVSVVGFFIKELLNEAGLPWALWLTAWTFIIVLVLSMMARNEIVMFLILRRFMEEGAQD